MVTVNKIKTYIKQVLGQGLTSCELATCLTIAILATTFPVFGLTTIAVTAVAIRKKLNLPLLLLVTYSLEPLRFLAFIPLTDFGSFVLSSPQNLTVATVKESFNGGLMELTLFFLHQFIYALVGWLLLLLPLA